MWEEIDKARKEKYHENLKEDFIDFTEPEDESRTALQAYNSQAMPSKDVEMAACGAIIKYLISKHNWLDECTEARMTENLGLTRNKVRKLLGLMEWQEIVASIPVGKATPYVVRDLSKALKEGYVSFSKSEADKFTRILLHTSWTHSVLGHFEPLQVIVEMVHASIPNPAVTTRSFLLGDKVFGKPFPNSGYAQIHRPFFPATVSSTNPGTDDYMLSFMFQMAGITRDFERANMVRDVLFEMNVPETLEEFDEAAFREALTRFASKNLRLSLLLTKPLYELVDQYGFDNARKKVEKWLYKDQKLQKAGGGGFSGLGIGYRYRLDPTMGQISSYTQEMTPGHVRFALNFVRAAIRLAQAAEVGEDNVNRAVLRVDALEASLDDGYRGREAEGMDLESWYQRRAS